VSPVDCPDIEAPVTANKKGSKNKKTHLFRFPENFKPRAFSVCQEDSANQEQGQDYSESEKVQ
jgi:hypothetical protein